MSGVKLSPLAPAPPSAIPLHRPLFLLPCLQQHLSHLHLLLLVFRPQRQHYFGFLFSSTPDLLVTTIMTAAVRNSARVLSKAFCDPPILRDLFPSVDHLPPFQLREVQAPFPQTLVSAKALPSAVTMACRIDVLLQRIVVSALVTMELSNCLFCSSKA
jgi:hypothetical protein